MDVNERPMTTIYAARCVVPVVASAIEDGALAIEGARIAGVGPRAELADRFPEARWREFGEAAIVPGFVNCHSHLELTAMRGFLEPVEHDFTAWLGKLTIARLTQMTVDDLYVSAAWGAVEAARAGVTCLGDASSAGAPVMAALREVGLRGTVFQEVFGPEPGLAEQQLEKLQSNVAHLRAGETALVRAGVSPHAPYSVSAPLLELVTNYALTERLPVMLHVAESHAEDLLMREGRGAFAENYARRGIAWRTPGVSTIQYLDALGVLRVKPLLAHCIRVDEADIETIRQAGAGVAHCPKSNAKFGHARAPFASFVKAGLAVGLGSDSVASNNTCDMLEEARFATLLSRVNDRSRDDEQRTSHLVKADEALRAATLGGAQALGMESQLGALAENMQADFAVVSLKGAGQLPFYEAARALIFASSARDVLLTVVAGTEVYREGRVTTVDEERLRARLMEIAQKLACLET